MRVKKFIKGQVSTDEAQVRANESLRARKVCQNESKEKLFDQIQRIKYAKRQKRSKGESFVKA